MSRRTARNLLLLLSSSSTPPVVIAKDSFTRADNAASMGTTEVGNFTWTVLTGGPFQINTNRAYCNATGNNIAYINAGVSDFTLYCTQLATGDNNLLFRLNHVTGNYWMVNTAGTTTTLYKYTGSFVSAGSAAGAAVGDIIKVVAKGSSITVYRNGTQIITTTDTQNQTATEFGFREGNNTGIWDDFMITVP